MVFLLPEMHGLGGMRLQAVCGKVSAMKTYVWAVNYGCILPSSYFSAFLRFSLVSRIKLCNI